MTRFRFCGLGLPNLKRRTTSEKKRRPTSLKINAENGGSIPFHGTAGRTRQRTGDQDDAICEERNHPLALLPDARVCLTVGFRVH